MGEKKLQSQEMFNVAHQRNLEFLSSHSSRHEKAITERSGAFLRRLPVTLEKNPFWPQGSFFHSYCLLFAEEITC